MAHEVAEASTLACLTWRRAKPLAKSGSTGGSKEIEGMVRAHVSRARPALAGKNEGPGPSDRGAMAKGTLEWGLQVFANKGLEELCLGTVCV